MFDDQLYNEKECETIVVYPLSWTTKQRDARVAHTSTGSYLRVHLSSPLPPPRLGLALPRVLMVPSHLHCLELSGGGADVQCAGRGVTKKLAPWMRDASA